MGSITDFLENELIDHVLNSAAYTPAGTVYLALGTADPTDAATGASMNEVANSGSYARKAITFGAASSRAITQSGDVDFDAATGNWGTVTHYALTDSATHGAGNALAHGSLPSPKEVISGNSPSVLSGQVAVSFDAGEISTYLADALLDHAFRNTPYTVPGTVWVALGTATLTDTTTGSTIEEPSGGDYARVQVNVSGGASPAWNAASNGIVNNDDVISFGTASASWGTVTSAAILDASTSGNVLFYDNAMTDQPVGDGDSVTFSASSLTVQIT